MTSKINLLMLLCSIMLCSSQCKKTNTPEPADQLPPATQLGANTFGCLVNGKIYVPKGSPNPKIQYDINLNGRPTLGITADQIVNSIYRGSILIAYRNLDHLGSYYMPNDFNFSAGWLDVIGTCGTVAYDTTIKYFGGGVITRLDTQARIISGTFNCKFKTLQCDTVFITDGRFDIKF